MEADRFIITILPPVQWMIDPGQNEPLTLYFNYFDTEEGSDKLKIYDGVSGDVIAEISGHYEGPPEPVTAASGKMMFAFITNNNIQDQGWEVWYDIDTGISENNNDFNF